MVEIFKETLENKPMIRIGKKSITDAKIQEIKILIKKYDMIKIKILKSLSDEIEKIIAQVLAKSGLNLLDLRGSSFILSKKPVSSLKISKKCQKITEMSNNYKLN
jgi:RNA-binding protein YhbY